MKKTFFFTKKKGSHRVGVKITAKLQDNPKTDRNEKTLCDLSTAGLVSERTTRFST